MGGFFSPSPATGSSSGSSTTTYNPSNDLKNQWQQILGTAGGLTTGPSGIVNDPLYHGNMVAGPGGLMNQYWGSAGQYGQGAPDMTGYQGSIGLIGAADINQYQDPNSINLPQNFNVQPGQINTGSFGNVPGVTAPNGPSGLASSYLVNPGQVSAPQAYSPQQIQAMMVSAPGSVNPITGVQNVNAPQLNQYQMGPAQQVNAPQLQNYSMQAAGNVAPSGLASSQSWTSPGTAASYMNPYTQQVVDAQLAQAQTQEQQQLQMQGAQAAQAGAFGGSRQAVEAANTSIGYQQLAAQLQAQGLQSAYQQGTQQFNTEQQLGMQGQQFNIQSGLQAALSNQQMQQQAAAQNLQSQLSTQQLGTQAGLQAALANQQAGLTVGGQNLQSQLATQQLGAQTGLQAALANQSMSYQTQLANQQAQEFGYGQQMQAGLANQQAGLAAQQANQGAGLQAGLANMQYQYGASQANQQAALQAGLAAQQLGLQGAQFNAGNQMNAALANQAAQMQAQGLTYQGGLQGALQTQNLGMQGQSLNAQLGLQAANQQAGLRQQQQGLNLSGFNQAGQMYGNAAGLGLQGYQAGLQGLGALQQGATSQQGYLQQQADAGYQQWLNSIALPMQGVGWLAGLTAMQPYSGTTSNVYSGTNTSMPAQASPFSQVIGGVMGGLGALGGLFGLKKGGLVAKRHGLAAVPARRSGGSGIATVPRRNAPARHGLGMVA